MPCNCACSSPIQMRRTSSSRSCPTSPPSVSWLASLSKSARWPQSARQIVESHKAEDQINLQSDPVGKAFMLKKPVPWPDGAQVAIAITLDLWADSLVRIEHRNDSITLISTVSMLKYGPGVGVRYIV